MGEHRMRTGRKLRLARGIACLLARAFQSKKTSAKPLKPRYLCNLIALNQQLALSDPGADSLRDRPILPAELRPDFPDVRQDVRGRCKRKPALSRPCGAERQAGALELPQVLAPTERRQPMAVFVSAIELADARITSHIENCSSRIDNRTPLL
jgi:hypothetical protein